MHQLYGTRVAVLAGDFMFAQSSWYLANLENLEVIKLISQVFIPLHFLYLKTLKTIKNRKEKLIFYLHYDRLSKILQAVKLSKRRVYSIAMLNLMNI